MMISFANPMPLFGQAVRPSAAQAAPVSRQTVSQGADTVSIRFGAAETREEREYRQAIEKFVKTVVVPQLKADYGAQITQALEGGPHAKKIRQLKTMPNKKVAEGERHFADLLKNSGISLKFFQMQLEIAANKNLETVLGEFDLVDVQTMLANLQAADPAEIQALVASMQAADPAEIQAMLASMQAADPAEIQAMVTELQAADPAEIQAMLASMQAADPAAFIIETLKEQGIPTPQISALQNFFKKFPLDLTPEGLTQSQQDQYLFAQFKQLRDQALYNEVGNVVRPLLNG